MHKKLLIMVIFVVFVLLLISALVVDNVAAYPLSSVSVRLKTPDNGAEVPCGVPVIFTWDEYDVTAYKFMLSMNPDMSDPVVMAVVEDVEYKYIGPLKCHQNYFWRVRIEEPTRSEDSATFSFHTSTSPPDSEAGSKNPFIFQQWVYIVIAAVLFLILVAGTWRILR
jgi:hypothetical protein